MLRKEVMFLEHAEMKSEIDLNSKLTKAVSCSIARPKPGNADKIFSLAKREKSFYKSTCNLKPTCRCFWIILSSSTNTNAKMKDKFLCLKCLL